MVFFRQLFCFSGYIAWQVPPRSCCRLRAWAQYLSQRRWWWFLQVPLKCQMLESDLHRTLFQISPDEPFPCECLLQHQISLNFISKLQTSVLKIQWSVRTDQGVMGIQCQIQPLQTSVVFLAGHHELRLRNQFFCFSWTRISCKNLLSDSQKCLELLGTFLMGWTPVKLPKINNTNDKVVMLISIIKPTYQQRQPQIHK